METFSMSSKEVLRRGLLKAALAGRLHECARSAGAGAKRPGSSGASSGASGSRGPAAYSMRCAGGPAIDA